MSLTLLDLYNVWLRLKTQIEFSRLSNEIRKQVVFRVFFNKGTRIKTNSWTQWKWLEVWFCAGQMPAPSKVLNLILEDSAKLAGSTRVKGCMKNTPVIRAGHVWKNRAVKDFVKLTVVMHLKKHYPSCMSFILFWMYVYTHLKDY